MTSPPRFLLPLLLVGTAAVCVGLGWWQRGRLLQRRAENREIGRALERPALSLRARGAESLAHRRVTAEGRFDLERQWLVRGQAFQGSPGVQVITPFLLAGEDSAVLVNRGFVAAPDAITIDLKAIDRAGADPIAGIALPLESRPDSGAPLTRNDVTSWRQLDLAASRRRLPYPLLGVVVLESPSPDAPPIPHRLEPRRLDDGPHLSYMVQWFSFAAIALVFAVIMARRRDTQREAPPSSS